MEIDSKSNQIKFRNLGGLDERAAPYALKGEDFWLLAGLYPAQDGLLERIPGKQYLTNVNIGTDVGSNPIQIWNIFPTNDGSGNIIVKTSVDVRIYTLDELLGRGTAASIDFTSSGDEDDMTMALMIHREANGVASGKLCQTDNVFVARKLTDMLFNDSTVSAFRPWNNGGGTFTVTLATPAVFTKIGHGLIAGDSVTLATTGALPTGLEYGRQYYVMAAGLGADVFQVSLTPSGAAINTSGSQSGVQTLYKNANQFVLTAGTYRIEATALFTGYQDTGTSICLYDVTNQNYEYFQGTAVPILSNSGFGGYLNSTNFAVKIDAQFTITSTKIYELRQVINNGFGTGASHANAGGAASTVTTGAYSEYYASVKILKTVP